MGKEDRHDHCGGGEEEAKSHNVHSDVRYAFGLSLSCVITQRSDSSQPLMTLEFELSPKDSILYILRSQKMVR